MCAPPHHVYTFKIMNLRAQKTQNVTRDESPQAGGLCYACARSSSLHSVGSDHASSCNSRLASDAPPRIYAHAPLGCAELAPAVCEAHSRTVAAGEWCQAAPLPAQTGRVALFARPVRAFVNETLRS